MKKPKQTPLQECEDAMARLRQTFNQGDNHFGAYGRSIREAYDRWSVTYTRLTGKEAPGIYR